MQKPMTSSHSKGQKAFTFIELLITVTVMVISLSIGVVNYLRFLDQQRLYQSGASVEAMLKDARSKAQNGFLGNEELGFCAQLKAIELSSSETVDEQLVFTAALRCTNNNLLTYETYSITQSGTTLDKNFKISFLPLRGAVILLNNIGVASGSALLQRNDNQVIFNFDQGGAVDVQYQ